MNLLKCTLGKISCQPTLSECHSMLWVGNISAWKKKICLKKICLLFHSAFSMYLIPHVAPVWTAFKIMPELSFTKSLRALSWLPWDLCYPNEITVTRTAHLLKLAHLGCSVGSSSQLRFPAIIWGKMKERGCSWYFVLHILHQIHWT